MRDLGELIAATPGLTGGKTWSALAAHADDLSGMPLAELLGQPGRFERCSRRAGDLLLDFSRQRITDESLGLLVELAGERRLPEWVEALFSGADVNDTEGRPALHVALRTPPGEAVVAAGQNIVPLVQNELDRFLGLASEVRGEAGGGRFAGPISDVVNIGIGGSDLGLVMATEALKPFSAPGIRMHFVSNIDGCQLADVLDRVRPENTLFIVCSKSFSTLETRLNAEAARACFLEQSSPDLLGRHFAAISVNTEAMDAFGIDPANRFALWDWVGGRYSLWSPIGLSIAIAIGPDRFRELLRGAAEMDRHFRHAVLKDNLPVLLGLLGVWNQNFLGVTSHAVLPYDQRLHRLPAFLQQLDMESNGKRVLRTGEPVECSTGTVIWGEPGSNAQHSFFQLLHQGTASVSMDFIAPVQPSSRFAGQHRQGLANMLAQAEALARGRPERAVREDLRETGMSPADIERIAPHKVHPGNRVSSILLLRQLDPASLGALVALYEHKVFVQSVIWGINPFDQWGVELGKTMAAAYAGALSSAEPPGDLPGIAAVIRDWQSTSRGP